MVKMLKKIFINCILLKNKYNIKKWIVLEIFMQKQSIFMNYTIISFSITLLRRVIPLWAVFLEVAVFKKPLLKAYK